MPDLQPSPRTVLVIDDDSILRELLSALLPLEGFTVFTASSGEAALECLQPPNPPMDVLLVDLHMPGLAGLDLVRRLITARAPGALLLGMSASTPDRFDLPLFDGFLRKPFGIPEFTAAIGAIPRSAPPPSTTTHPQSDILDEVIYTRLAALLPAEQLRELYRITVEDVRRRIELMRTAVVDKDVKQYRAEAHAIKGGCGMVGATQLSLLAASAETGSPLVNPLFQEFDDACTRLQRMLDARFAHE
jgi:DNA-binding response OmpR family regulator